jgi:hypothetical protein
MTFFLPMLGVLSKLKKLTMVNEYVNMVKLMFENVESCVCFNGSIIKSFKIERGIK